MSGTIDDFLRQDPSARYVLRNVAAERRLRERDNLSKDLPAVVVHYGDFRWIKIVDSNGIAHIEQV
jgi:hypothetical protein